MRKTTTLFAVSLLLSAPVAVSAQVTPPNWKVVADAPVKMINTEIVSDSTLWFVTMAPGWHVTMGPGGLLYDPRYFADGRFDVEMEFFIFPNASNEEIGVFVGGTDLDGAGKAYTAFVVRRDGSAAVIRRAAGREAVVKPWAISPAVLGPEKTGKNVVRVAMDSAGVHFLVNGTLLGTWPHGELSLSGNFGFRVGKLVNMHITRLDAQHRLGPVRAGK